MTAVLVVVVAVVVEEEERFVQRVEGVVSSQLVCKLNV